MKDFIQINGKKIELSKETIGNFEGLLEKKDNPRRPKADGEGDYGYYYLHNRDSYGVRIEKSGHCDRETMEKDFEAGVGFKTREEGETKLEWMRAVERVKDYIAEEFGEFEPGKCELKYNLFYKELFNKFDYELYTSVINYSPIGYLKTQWDANKVIDNCEDDLKIIWGIK